MASDMASAETNQVGIDFESISDLFDEGMELYNEIMTSQNSQVQGVLIKAIEVLETVTRWVSESKLFTSFKTLHDVPSSHLKLFVIPALLGFLNLKTWQSDRNETMYVAQTYFKDFLGRTRSFGLLDARPPGVVCSSSAGHVVETPSPTDALEPEDVDRQRDAKLRRRAQQDEMTRQLAELKRNLATLEQLRSSRGQGQLTRKGKERLRAEKQMERCSRVTLIRWFANQVIDEMEIMEWDKLLINYMADLSLGPTFFEEELKSKLGELPRMKCRKPVLISDGQFLDEASIAELKKLRTMLHGNLYDIVFQDPLVPSPPTPRPSIHELLAPEEVRHSVIAEEKEEAELTLKQEEPKTKEAEPRMKESSKQELLRTEEAENKAKAKGKKKKA